MSPEAKIAEREPAVLEVEVRKLVSGNPQNTQDCGKIEHKPKTNNIVKK